MYANAQRISPLIEKYCWSNLAEMYLEFTRAFYKMESDAIFHISSWSPDLCDGKHEDTLEQVMKLSAVTDYFDTKIQAQLGECHPNNIVVKGVTRLLVFHANSPPYDDAHEYLPSMCKAMKHLKHSWEPVVHACPDHHTTSLISDIVAVHELVCAMSHAASETSNVVSLWAEEFLKQPSCQRVVQFFNQMAALNVMQIEYYMQQVPFTATLDCMMDSLEDALNQLSDPNQQFQALYGKLASVYPVADGQVDLGLNLSSEDMGIYTNFNFFTERLVEWGAILFSTFLVEGGFIDYDPDHVPHFL